MFRDIFKIEVNMYKIYSEFLCKSCERELNASHKFYIQVKKCLEYSKCCNKEIKDEDEVKEQELNINNFKESDFSDSDNEPLSVVKKRNQNAQRLKKIPLNDVKEAIESFKNGYNENTACIFCTFIAATARTLSTHMALKHRDEKRKWCLMCNKTYDNVDEHKKIHSKAVKCKFCKKAVTRAHYIDHLKVHAGMEYECALCNKTFISKLLLIAHKADHKNERPFECPVCFKTFSLSEALKLHLKTHGKYSCKDCDKNFEIPELLTAHICVKESEISNTCLKLNIADREIKSDEQDIKYNAEDVRNDMNSCNNGPNICGNSKEIYIKKDQEQVKEAMESKKIEGLMCIFCQKSYKTTYKLRLHLRGHTGDLPFKCQYCDRRSAVKAELENHERSHTKEKPFMCNICGKALSAASALRTHMRQHTGRPEQCQLCEKRFCRKSELRLHMQKHRGERPYLCPECGLSFAQRSHLTEHLSSHSDERPYQCNFCDKAFKKNMLLKQHILLHSGNKTFKCPHCSYACYKKYRLEQHMKMHDSGGDVKSTEHKNNICPICNKGFTSLSMYNSHMSGVHNALV